MDLTVRCFTVNEHTLFNFPEYVDSLLKENPDVKDAGVFKVYYQYVLIVWARSKLYLGVFIHLFFFILRFR